MIHTKGNAYRRHRHYTEVPQKPEILRLWALHVGNAEISRRLGVPVWRIADIIRNALLDGEIEERRIVHAEAENI